MSSTPVTYTRRKRAKLHGYSTGSSNDNDDSRLISQHAKSPMTQAASPVPSSPSPDSSPNSSTARNGTPPPPPPTPPCTPSNDDSVNSSSSSPSSPSSSTKERISSLINQQKLERERARNQFNKRQPALFPVYQRYLESRTVPAAVTAPAAATTNRYLLLKQQREAAAAAAAASVAAAASATPFGPRLGAKTGRNVLGKLMTRELSGTRPVHRQRQYQCEKQSKFMYLSSVPARFQFPVDTLFSGLPSGLVVLGFSRCGRLLVSYTSVCRLVEPGSAAAAVSVSSVYTASYQLQFWQFSPFNGGRLRLLCRCPLFGGQSVPAPARSLLLSLVQSPDEHWFIVHGAPVSESSVSAAAASATPDALLSARHHWVTVVPSPTVPLPGQRHELATSLTPVAFSFLVHAPFPQFQPAFCYLDHHCVFNTGNGLLLVRLQVSDNGDCDGFPDNNSCSTSNSNQRADNNDDGDESSVSENTVQPPHSFDFPDNSMLDSNGGATAAAADNDEFHTQVVHDDDDDDDDDDRRRRSRSRLQGAGFVLDPFGCEVNLLTVHVKNNNSNHDDWATTGHCRQVSVPFAPTPALLDEQQPQRFLPTTEQDDDDDDDDVVDPFNQSNAGEERSNYNSNNSLVASTKTMLVWRSSVETLLLKMKSTIPKLEGQLIDYDMRIVALNRENEFNAAAPASTVDDAGVTVVVYAHFSANKRRRQVLARTNLLQIGALFRLSFNETTARLVRVLDSRRLVGHVRPYMLNRLCVETARRLRERWARRPLRTVRSLVHQLSNKSVFTGASLRFILNPFFPMALVSAKTNSNSGPGPVSNDTRLTAARRPGQGSEFHQQRQTKSTANNGNGDDDDDSSASASY